MVKNNFFIKYLVAIVLILACHKFAFDILNHYITDVMYDLIIGIANYASLILSIAIWILCLIQAIKSVYYHGKTGRDLKADQKEFHKDLSGLIEFIKKMDPYKINASSLPIGQWWTSEGVILGHIGDRLIYRPSDGVGNLALFGLPGSHKTTAQIIPSALRFNGASGGGVFCIDIKGDVLAWTRGKRKIKIFDPEDDLSCHFDIFGNVKNMTASELRTYAEMIAVTILPDSNGKEDSYFTSGGRSFFIGIMLYLLNENVGTTFSQVIDYILCNNAIDVCKTIAASNCLEAQRYTNSMIGSSERNVSGCYDCIAKAVRPYTTGALTKLLDGEGECISPNSLLNGYDVYIEIPQDKIAVYASITSLIVQTFLSAFMQMPDIGTTGGILQRPSVIFLMDEFAQLSFDFSTLSQALSTLRSKGVSLFLCMQSIAQLAGKYGEINCRGIIDTCSFVTIMGAQDPSSREYFQKLIGRQLVIRKSTSENKNGSNASRGESFQETMEYIFESADFGSLGDDIIVCINGKYIRCQKTDCWNSPYTITSSDCSPSSTRYLEIHDNK